MADLCSIKPPRAAPEGDILIPFSLTELELLATALDRIDGPTRRSLNKSGLMGRVYHLRQRLELYL